MLNAIFIVWKLLWLIFFTSEPVHGAVKIISLLSNILFTLDYWDTQKEENNGFCFYLPNVFLLLDTSHIEYELALRFSPLFQLFCCTRPQLSFFVGVTLSYAQRFISGFTFRVYYPLYYLSSPTQFYFLANSWSLCTVYSITSHSIDFENQNPGKGVSPGAVGDMAKGNRNQKSGRKFFQQFSSNHPTGTIQQGGGGRVS